MYVSYDNSGIRAEGGSYPAPPVFDIKVSAQRKNVYSKVQQNELALELYQSGCFNPSLADQALLLLDTMDFDGRERLIRKIRENSGLTQRLDTYRQLALALAAQYDAEVYSRLASEDEPTGAQPKKGVKRRAGGESAVTLKARKRTAQTTMPR